jgi:hypothetical protein
VSFSEKALILVDNWCSKVRQTQKKSGKGKDNITAFAGFSKSKKLTTFLLPKRNLLS